MAIRLKSRQQCPVNGFWATVPETDFSQQFWRFSDAVDALWNHLQTNKGLDKRFPHLPKTPQECEEYIDLSNAMRMLSIAGADIYVMDASPPPKLSAPRSFWQAAVGGTKKLSAGAGVLIDWLGSGAAPVTPELSEARAQICAGCPQNKSGGWSIWFTKPIADRIQKQVEMSKELKLQTSVDDKLGVCAACLCPMQLKVHVPIEHIRKGITEQISMALDPRCWIPKEMA